MVILIYGGRGWIGSQIIQILQNKPFEKEVIVSDIRLDNLEKVEEELLVVNPDRVICCVGRTSGVYNGQEVPSIDYLEKPGKLQENIRDNLYGPFMLAFQCNQLGIHLTYMGTGCIFTYTEKEKIFTESSTPNFFGSGYSTVKGFTDQMMKQLPNVLNVRIRMPITLQHNPRSLLDKLLKYPRICSIPNSMTILDELLPVMCDLLDKKEVGTINLVNPGVIDHDTILKMYQKYVNPNHKYELMTYEEQSKILLSGRSNNELSADKLKEWYPSISSIDKGIEKIMQAWGTSKGGKEEKTE